SPRALPSRRSTRYRRQGPRELSDSRHPQNSLRRPRNRRRNPAREDRMITGTLREFAAAFGQPLLPSDGALDTPFTGVTIDSRQPLPDSIFFAIIGENQDGHNFVKAAVAAGSRIVIVNKSRFAEI